VLYATFLAWPGEEAVIGTLRGASEEEDSEENQDGDEGHNEIEDVPSLVGKTFTIKDDDQEYKWVFKENGKVFVSGGDAGEGIDGQYEQEGREVFLTVAAFELEGTYDGEEFKIIEDEAPEYPGFYPQEIKRVSMLGDGKSLDWKVTRKGLIIETPDKKPCKHAYVIKIERYHHPKIK